MRVNKYLILSLSYFFLLLGIVVIICSCGKKAEEQTIVEELTLKKQEIREDPEMFITVGLIGCDFTTLKEAVNHADTVKRVIYLMDPVHTESGIILAGDIEIRGFGPHHTIFQASEDAASASDRVFLVEKDAVVILSNFTIQNGNTTSVPKRGAGVSNHGNLTLEHMVVRDNTAVYGAGIWNAGHLVMNFCTISGNHTLLPTTKELLDGTGCTGCGGGIKNEPGGEMALYRCTISENSSLKRGGGLFLSCESKTKLINCTVSGNDCKRSGGGIHIRGDLEMVHCTIAHNSSLRRGGGIYNLGHLDFSASIVAGNENGDFIMGSGGGYYGEGQIGTNEYNFVGASSIESYMSGDPRLGSLAVNNGETMTHALLRKSPAVDVVPISFHSIDEDQRGLSRHIYKIGADGFGDLGAYEQQ
jgi:hypothetical protein